MAAMQPSCDAASAPGAFSHQLCLLAKRWAAGIGATPRSESANAVREEYSG